MAHRSQCSSAGDNPLDPNYLTPHYREEYRMAIDALVEADLEGYYGFLQEADVVDFLSRSEIEYIKCMVQAPHHTAQPERRYMAEDVDGSSDTYWPVHSDHDAPSLDLGWPQQFRFVGPTEVTTLVNPSDPEMPSIKEQVRRMIKNAQQVIAVVMDMFTDVDIFADILGAATRGVAVYVLLDELNAHHFVAMVNNCRVNLDEIKFMRVRTVSGSSYYCRTGKTFKGQMMDRFILVDCRAVLSGNYSFMWSFEKIHRCLAHLFLGQLVTTFDEEFRILFAHSEPLVVENVLANMPHSSGEPESYYNTEKTHMFNREYPTMGMECAGRTTEDHMKLGYKMLPFRSESIHSAAEANPSVQRNMNLHAAQKYRRDHQFIEHGRQMRGPNETVGFKRHSSGNIPDYEYMPPQNHPTIRGKQYTEGAIPHGGHFAQEPCIHKGAGLQSGYDMHGRFRGQCQHIGQFSGPGYPHEGEEDEPPGAYDHIQRYLQSHPAMEEGHGPRNVLPPVQFNLKRHSMGQPYTCQTSPTQPNPPEQRCFFNVSRKAQDVSQKQGLRDWRISSYLSAYDDAGELDLAELEGSTACDDIPCFTQEAPCGPIRAEIRLGNREFNRIPSPRENPMFVQIQNNSIVPDSSVNHPSDLSQINIKTTPASTSESSCTTEGDKVEETQNREPKETSRISEEFLKRKPSRHVQRSSRLRHSLIFSSNLELHASEEMKHAGGEKHGDDASKFSARVSQILDKSRTGSPLQPFQWSSYVKSATFDNSASESAQPEDELNKMGENSDVDKVKNCQNLRKNSIKGDLQEKDLPQTVPETNSQRDECPSNLLQKSSSFIDMNDPDCRLRYFKELAAKRKLEAAKASQSNPMKATQKFTLPEKPSTVDADKTTGHVFKIPETPLKSKNTSFTVTEIKETYKDTKCEESSKDILHRATDAEKIRFKKKLAEESGSSLKVFKGDIDQALKEEARTVSTAKNQTPPILNIFSQKPLCASQNQVVYVALDTTSTESGLNQYRISKETDPSHAVLTESCLPIKLPQTKCVSSLRTTPNEGSLSANDSQTLAQSLPNIFGTCSDTVPLDSNSTANLAIVDTCVPSKNYHKDTVPSPAFYHTTGISSTKHSTAIKADSSQHLNETGADFSKHSTAVGAEPSTAENVYFQYHSATEKNSSQQHTLIEFDSSKPPTTTESEPSRKSTSTEADSSQHTPASKIDCFQQPAAVRKDFSLHPTATECGTSKNFPITTETDSFQQPTAAKSESSHHSTTIKAASSQQPTETGDDSFQPPTKSGTDFCQHSTAVESENSEKSTAVRTDPTTARNKPSQQCTDVSSDFSKHPPAVKVNSSQNPTAAEMNSSEQSAASVMDSPQHHMAKESKCSLKPTVSGTQPFIQLNASAAATSQHPSAVEADSSQQPTATATDSSQHPTATATNSSQQPTQMEKDPSQKSTAVETYYSQHAAAAVTDSSQHPTTTVTDSPQQPIAMEADPSQKLTASMVDAIEQLTASEADTPKSHTTTKSDLSTEPFKQLPLWGAGSSQQATATTTGSSQKPTKTITDSSQQPTATETDSSQQPTATETDSSQQPTATETDSSQQPTTTETDSSREPTATETDSSQQPTATETDSSREPTAAETDSSQQPTAKETDSSQQPTATETDSSREPTAAETDSSQQPTAKEADSSQHPTATETESSREPTAAVINSYQQPTATENDSSQQPTATETDSSQQPTATETDSSQQPTTTEADSSREPTATETDSSREPTAAVTDSSQQPTAKEADSSQHPTATETESSREPTAAVINSYQQPTATENDSSQQPTATETDSSQQPTTTEADSSREPTATETDSSREPTATETDSSQQPTTTEADSSREPTATETDSSQEPTAVVTDSSQQPTATETDSSRKPTAAVTNSSQQPAATEIGFSQKPTAADQDCSQKITSTGTVSSQQPTATVTDSSQQPTAKETNTSQQPTATETNSSQEPTATETDSSQEPTAVVTDSSQQPTATETDSSRKPTAAVTNSSQQPAATEIGFSQKPTAADQDCSQKITSTGTVSSQQPTATVTDSSDTDSSQQPTATEADSSPEPTAAGTDTSQKSTSTGTDSSQQPTVIETDFSQEPTAKDTGSFQQPVTTEEDSSREPTAADTDFSQKSSATETDSSPEPTAAVTDTSQKSTSTVTDSSQKTTAITTDSFQQSFATETDSSQQPAAKETDSSQKHTVTATDSFQQSVPTETDSSQQLSITESEFSQNPTKMWIDTSKHPIETENESLQDITATKSDCVNEKKDENLSEAFSKLIPIPEANNTQKENSISQNAVITDSGSPAKHSQSETVTPCDSQVELNQPQAWAKPCITPTVKDTDNGALTSLDSVEVSSTQSQGSPEPCLSSNEINSTQGITQLQSSFSSNPMESSCQNDSKPEKTDECQKSDTEQTQNHDTSAVDAGPKIAHIEVSTATDSNEVDKFKQTTPEVENTVTNFAEVSEKSHLTVHSNSSKSSVAENAKSIMSAHQTSTANVISCSNLRDDTKVLLEQISAKNQSRSSQSKQTLAAPNEAKKGEVSSADKLFSNNSGRPWSSKATPEEREMLLQKMEQMRKERKAYSRFETS
ncbi:serine-rich adhesin for platelets-like isoform X1 [Sinocyclocheilus anshuiensis]|uniref:serine-rich adhesin for platelets-like isoform X1 n=1 Tax=Sinocyclocheilus anshuiensis TaxID=1608454 RepID=UPI0007B92C30|nr:PREDICTED: serine-rich adhesin for platelets-like isoform X1 [Sinocyclocheilus anshuiensis]